MTKRRVFCWMLGMAIMSTNVLGQVCENMHFMPAEQSAKKIAFTYDPTSTPLNNSDSLKALVYLVEVSQEDPVVADITLHKRNNLWQGEVPFGEKNVAIMVILKNQWKTIDNNNNQGYWTPIYTQGKVKPGAFASIAYLYASGWDPETFHLARQNKIAKALFEREFAENAAMKRLYFRYYLTTFDITQQAEFEQFKKQLDQFSQYEDLTEWELLAISKHYKENIGDTTSAGRYNRLIFSRYPDGCWATQMGTMKLQREFAVADAADDLAKKKAVYEQLKQLVKPSADECARRYTEIIKGIRMLSRLTPYYHKSGTMDAWMNELNQLSNEFKYPTLIFGARSLNAAGEPAVAEKLAKPAIDWMKAYIDTTYRNATERAYYTLDQLKEFRKQRYGEFLAIYGQSLLLQNKLPEAVNVLEEAAILYGKGANETSNQYYVEALMKSGRVDEAILNCQKFIISGKSNAIIEKHYRSLTGAKENAAYLKQEYSRRLMPMVEKKLISKELPAFTLFDTDGKPVTLDTYRNKTIVIDFWASWCAPCIGGFDAMQKVVTQYQADPDVVFLFINVESGKASQERAKKLFETRNYPFILLFDDRSRSAMLAGVGGLPTKLLIDKSGKIRFNVKGLHGNTDEQVAELSAMIETIR